MNKQRPTPQVPAAYQALYGKPSREDKQREVLELFRKLSDHNQERALTFAEALAAGDTETTDRLRKEIDTEHAYLEHYSTGGES